MLLLVFLAYALAFQLRAECHAFHFSQGVRISVLRQELHDISQIDLRCTIVAGSPECGCSVGYIGDTGRESIWLLTLDPVKQCNVSSEIVVSAMYKQMHGVSSSEIRLHTTNGAVAGYCGMNLDWMKSTLAFLSPSHTMQIHLSIVPHKLTTLDISRAQPSVLCPGHTVLQLQDRIRDSTQRSHAALVQEIERVVQRLGDLAAPDARLILLAASNEYMAIRAATMNVFVRLICQGLFVKYVQEHNAISISITSSSKRELTSMFMSLFVELLHDLALHNESQADLLAEALFGVHISNIKASIEQRAVECFVHGIQTLYGYTYLDPDLSGFMHCLLQSEFVPSVKLTVDKHGVDLIRAITTLRKQPPVVKLSPGALGITSMQVFLYRWRRKHLTCILACLCIFASIIVIRLVCLKWQVIKHLILSRRAHFKPERIYVHAKAYDMV